MEADAGDVKKTGAGDRGVAGRIPKNGKMWQSHRCYLQRNRDETEPLDWGPFLRTSVSIGVVGYLVFAIVSTITILIVFPQLKWSHRHEHGLQLQQSGPFRSRSSVRKENGLVAALTGCRLIKSVVSVACILMQDFKTAHYTQNSPRAMILSQAFDVGNPKGDFKAPYALVYRNMAKLGVQGFSALQEQCLQQCYGFFAFSALVNHIRDLAPLKFGKRMPLPMLNAKKAELMVPVVASGLICGEVLWILPASVLALASSDMHESWATLSEW
ncbi:hypothetical protein MLD38_039219 [Melastoma candidum]|uniref:Uncharacterized protein n=1 Tax=Melastoma candidum TaxID=119954 RepID=A0ACB9L1E2_9MYRT|nr:hypothetical protein MLD38_039219 [Melastoma candidum]